MFNKTRDFARIFIMKNASISKIRLTKSTTTTKMTAPRNIEGGRGNPLPKGDNNSPQLKAVFLCLSFFNLVEFDLIKLNIMMVLFGQPLWLVVPLGGISTPFNTVTNTVESIGVGFILQTKGITDEN